MLHLLLSWSTCLLFLLEPLKHKKNHTATVRIYRKKKNRFLSRPKTGGSHQQPVVPIYRFDRPEGALAQPGHIVFFVLLADQKKSDFRSFNPIRKVYSQVWLLKSASISMFVANLPISPQFLWTNLRCSLKPNSWKQICASYCGWMDKILQDFYGGFILLCTGCHVSLWCKILFIQSMAWKIKTWNIWSSRMCCQSLCRNLPASCRLAPKDHMAENAQ